MMNITFKHIITCAIIAIYSITIAPKIQAQNRTITFTSTDQSNIIDSIHIENRTQNTKVTLLGTETLTAIQNPTSSSPETPLIPVITIYPNPMNIKSFVDIVIKEKGEATLQVYSLMGEKIIQDKHLLIQGISTYEISGLAMGTYILKLSLAKQTYAATIISLNQHVNRPQIHVSSSNMPLVLKSAQKTNNKSINYTDGDTLLFIGFSGTDLVDSIDVVLKKDTNIQFIFEKPFDYVTVLNNSYNKFKWLVEYAYLFDAAYSNSKQLTADWNMISTHQHNGTDPQISTLWNEAYNTIYMLNSIINNAYSIRNPYDKEQAVAQAKCMRAYLYLALSKWFGDIPIEMTDRDFNSARASKDEVLTLALSDLQYAIDSLPQSSTNQSNIPLNSYFAQGLKCRTLIEQQNYSEAILCASSIINSKAFSLSIDIDTFIATNPEIIYGFEEINNYAYKANYSWPYIPVLRLTEILLLRAEAHIKTNNETDAKADINILRSRRGLNALSQTLTLNDLFDHWNIEIKHEGSTFQSFKRFEKIQDIFPDLEQFKYILPIPNMALDTHQNFLQNPGY